MNEPEIAVFNYINENLLKTDGIRIPEIIYNNFELANSQYLFEDAIELRTYYFEFTGISSPKILSDKTLFAEIDLKKPNPSKTEKSVVVEITKGGVLNGLRLTSPLKVFDNITFDSSDSLMPPVIIPLIKDLKVLKGNKVKLAIEYNFENGWDKFRCEATLL